VLAIALGAKSVVQRTLALMDANTTEKSDYVIREAGSQVMYQLCATMMCKLDYKKRKTESNSRNCLLYFLLGRTKKKG
jgi:hypothetical protein